MNGRQIFHLTEQISLNLSEDWPVERMAAEVGLSISRFHHAFKEHFKTTPQEYLRDARLNRARLKLEDPHNFDSIKTIAYEVGIKDESHFTRDFKKKFGQTPTEYRENSAKRHLNNDQ
jgi:AraC-like DNA-binding protein